MPKPPQTIIIQPPQRITSQQAPNVTPARSYASPMDVYEDEVGFDSPFSYLSTGTRRIMWQIPDIAITHTPLSSVLTSASQSADFTQAQIIGGGIPATTNAPASGWSVVPNMEATIIVNGPAQITASLIVQSNVANDTISFAVYRAGKQITPAYQQTTSNANTPTFVQISTVDNTLLVHSPLNREVYQLYWKAGSGALTTTNNQRTFYVTNLVPA